MAKCRGESSPNAEKFKSKFESENIWVLVLPSMPKGEIVGKYLIDNECLSLMEGTTMKMA